MTAATEDKKIDVVYTWVDGAAPGHAELVEHHATNAHDRNPNRYRDNLELLKYSLRSLERHAGSLVRNVYVVTMRPQLPAWLDVSAPDLRVVHHDQLMPEDELPTFNSFAIVSHLHKLAGLSARFLYVEDDQLFGADVRLSDFVARDGRAVMCAEASATERGALAHDPRKSPWNNALAYSNALLDARYGRARRARIAHAPLVIDTQRYKEFLETFAQAVDATRHSRFRGARNIAPEHMYPHWLLHEGRARCAPYLHAYRGSGYASLTNSALWNRAQLAWLRVLRPKVYCLNDSFGISPDARAVEVVRAFLERELGTPSRFERARSRQQ